MSVLAAATLPDQTATLPDQTATLPDPPQNVVFCNSHKLWSQLAKLVAQNDCHEDGRHDDVVHIQKKIWDASSLFQMNLMFLRHSHIYSKKRNHRALDVKNISTLRSKMFPTTWFWNVSV